MNTIISEYDAFIVGEPRPVYSFVPLYRIWVRDYAAPIVAPRVAPADPDAMMEPEPWSYAYRNQHIKMLRAVRRRRDERITKLIAHILDHGPISMRDAKQLLGCSEITIRRMCRMTDGLLCTGRGSKATIDFVEPTP